LWPHRRREKTCQIEKPELPLAVRRYALYHVQATGEQSVAELRRLFERTAANAQLPTLDFVQLVEFGAGIHAVISSHAQVQSSWRQDVGQNAGDVIGGLIASHGIAAAEGERLAQERIESLADVIEPVAPAGITREFDVLARVPDALNEVSNDGVIILVTRAQVSSNCHTIIAVENESRATLLTAAAHAGSFAAALAADKLAKNLGKVNFSAATPNSAQLQAVVQAWDALDFKPATTAAVVANANDPASSAYATQSKAILSALGSTGATVAAATPETLEGCPAVTIVVGSVQRRNVLFIYGNYDRPNHFLQANPSQSPGEFRNNVEQGDALKNFINGLGANRPINGVTVTVPAGAPDAGAPTRLQAVLNAMTATGRTLPVSTRRQTGSLNAHDRTELANQGIDPDKFDDVIFFELNTGA